MLVQSVSTSFFNLISSRVALAYASVPQMMKGFGGGGVFPLKNNILAQIDWKIENACFT